MTKNNILLFFLFIGFLDVSAQDSNIKSSIPAVEKKVDSVLSLMTLDEKIGQLVQYNGSWDLTGPASEGNSKHKEEQLKKGLVGSMLNVLTVEATTEAQKLVMENSRLKIPLLFGYDVIHGYKTIFPIPLGETASWDLDAMEHSAQIAALESVAHGVNWTFSPMIDISRDARWGRIMEGSGEDPYLTSQVAIAKIKGYQGTDLSNSKTIAATAKHFAGYGLAEGGKDYNTVNIGENELHNVVLPPFRAAAAAGVATFMTSFNELDGIPATAHKELLRGILKEKWHWNGFVVSDWGSIAEMETHGFTKDLSQAAQLAMQAGVDMDMEGGAYESSLSKLVKAKKLDPKLIDDAARRILRMKYKLGLFEDPYRYCNPELLQQLSFEEHQKVARDVARKSIVLLKNEESLLPIKKSIKKIAIIGPLANDKDSPLGNWRAQGKSNSAISVVEGVQAAVRKTKEISFAEGTKLATGERGFLIPLEINTSDRSGFAEAIEKAKAAELVIMVLGEDAYQDGEGRSQADIGLAGLQKELLKEVYHVNPNIVLVLINGRPLDINWASQHIPAIVEAWQLGTESGNAIADVLLGKYNPSGKLPVSFPRAVGQEPLYYNHKNTGRPSNPKDVTFSHYTDLPQGALFPFGFGLSYSVFKYGTPSLSATEMNENESIDLRIPITNSGKVAGKEVVQLYLRDKVASRTRPILELKKFKMIALKPGETKTVHFTINNEMLEFYSANKKWESEAGESEVFIGGNSRDLKKQEFTLKK